MYSRFTGDSEMAGTPGHSGGARPGAGRKSTARYQRLEPILEQIDERLQSTLEERLNALEQLAAGGLQVITERWEMAGTLLIDGIRPLLDSDGNPTGKSVPCKLPLFPDKPAGELVLVSRTVKILPPNLAANVYLVNRLLGKPAPLPAPPYPAYELPSLSREIEEAIARIYGPDSAATEPVPAAASPTGPTNPTPNPLPPLRLEERGR